VPEVRTSRKRPTLACLGDLTLDIVVRADDTVDVGTDVAAVIRFRAGGSSANTARAFAALGGRAVFIGAVGDDDVGARLTRFMSTSGVVVHTVKRRGQSPRLAVIVGPDGERSFLTDRGVADSLPPRGLKKSWLAKIDALHLPAYSLLTAPMSEAAFAAIERAHAGSAVVSVDLASTRPLMARGRDAARDVVKKAAPDILFANEGEAAAVAGSRDARRLLDLAPLVVVKQGAEGCRLVWRAPDGSVVQSSVATTRVGALDTTGAGDAFDAGFLYSLLSGGYRRGADLGPAQTRRAALAGHRSAARLLLSPRKELRF
jgi:sugar/nucleoside kinase (ribokinase family)